MRDLNDLQFFVAVVTQRSFSAAARFLGVPKSRVSRRVALFEERLAVRLLERSTRRLSVTEIGQIVFEHARASLVEADAIEEKALLSRAEPRGLVKVSCPLGFTASIADLLPTLLLRNPLLRVQLIVTNRRVDLVEHLGVHHRDLTPTRNIGHVDPSADHVAQRRSCLVEGDLYAAQCFSCLGADVIGRPRPCRAGHRDVWADAYRT